MSAPNPRQVPSGGQSQKRQSDITVVASKESFGGPEASVALLLLVQTSLELKKITNDEKDYAKVVSKWQDLADSDISSDPSEGDQTLCNGFRSVYDELLTYRSNVIASIDRLLTLSNEALAFGNYVPRDGDGDQFFSDMLRRLSIAFPSLCDYSTVNHGEVMEALRTGVRNLTLRAESIGTSPRAQAVEDKTKEPEEREMTFEFMVEMCVTRGEPPQL